MYSDRCPWLLHKNSLRTYRVPAPTTGVIEKTRQTTFHGHNKEKNNLTLVYFRIRIIRSRLRFPHKNERILETQSSRRRDAADVRQKNLHVS